MKTLVTGSSDGLGKATTKLLLSQGHAVVGVSRRAISFDNDNYVHKQCDLSDATQVNALLDYLREHPYFDGLVNNAAVFAKRSYKEASTDFLQNMYFCNVSVPYMLISTLAKSAQRKRSVVNISSLGGIQEREKFSGFSSYSMTKSALCTMTQTLAVEFKEEGLGSRINCLAPGAMRTDMLQKALGGAYPGGASPDSIAKSVAFLLSDESEAMNGEIITLTTN
jgi:meso-butanediol dehydrogenase/(S,S)-butanediol dehydrogenase/diacetyl reductase